MLEVIHLYRHVFQISSIPFLRYPGDSTDSHDNHLKIRWPWSSRSFWSALERKWKDLRKLGNFLSHLLPKWIPLKCFKEWIINRGEEMDPLKVRRLLKDGRCTGPVQYTWSLFGRTSSWEPKWAVSPARKFYAGTLCRSLKRAQDALLMLRWIGRLPRPPKRSRRQFGPFSQARIRSRMKKLANAQNIEMMGTSQLLNDQTRPQAPSYDFHVDNISMPQLAYGLPTWPTVTYMICSPLIRHECVSLGRNLLHVFA